jgi:hypothetical protein
VYIKQSGEAVLPNVFQNGSNSTREAAPLEEPELELFSKEPEPWQTGHTSGLSQEPMHAGSPADRLPLGD